MVKRDPPATSEVQGSAASMNLLEIKELIDLVTETGISELELERPGVRIKIVRNTGSRAVAAPAQETDSSASQAAIPRNLETGTATTSAAKSQSSSENASDTSAAGQGLRVVRSPMVGTFYSAPSQGSEPFVRIGDKVKPGQVLCVIEAMKLMNEIEAEAAGEITKCYVENAQPVEYGEPLFELRPATAPKAS